MKAPFPVMLRSPAPLFCKTSPDPARPVTVPPTENPCCGFWSCCCCSSTLPRPFEHPAHSNHKPIQHSAGTHRSTRIRYALEQSASRKGAQRSPPSQYRQAREMFLICDIHGSRASHDADENEDLGRRGDAPRLGRKLPVIPTEAGTHLEQRKGWIPACAGTPDGPPLAGG